MMVQTIPSDSNYSDAESLLEWDDERTAEFVAIEKKKNEEEKTRMKWIERHGLDSLCLVVQGLTVIW